jgi:hypothetical protein
LRSIGVAVVAGEGAEGWREDGFIVLVGRGWGVVADGVVTPCGEVTASLFLELHAEVVKAFVIVSFLELVFQFISWYSAG